MQAEKSYPHETRIIYILSQNTTIILEKSGIVKLKKENLLLYVYLLTLTNV